MISCFLGFFFNFIFFIFKKHNWWQYHQLWTFNLNSLAISGLDSLSLWTFCSILRALLLQITGIEVLGMQSYWQVPQLKIQRIKAKLLIFSASIDAIWNHHDAGKGDYLTDIVLLLFINEISFKFRTQNLPGWKTAILCIHTVQCKGSDLIAVNIAAAVQTAVMATALSCP